MTVNALWRGPESAARVVRAERNLVRMIAEWAPGAGVGICFLHHPTRRTIEVDISPLGPAPAQWNRDIADALEPVMSVRTTRRSRPIRAIRHLEELVRDPARSTAALSARESATASQILAEPPQIEDEVGWPMPFRRSGDGILEAVRSVPGAFVEVWMAAPTGVELTMVIEQLRHGWNRAAEIGFDEYLGSPVRIRTFVGSVSDAVSLAPVRSRMRGWGSALTFQPCDETETDELFGAPGEALVGHVRPEGWALSQISLPVAGNGPELGIASRQRPIAPRPLEPVPARTRTSLEIGSARTTTGRRTPVHFDATHLTRHAFIEGKTGTGKSTLITTLVSQLSARGIGFTLLDHHGTGIDTALRAIDPTAVERVKVIRHGDSASPAGLNLLNEADIDVRERLSSEFTELIQSIYDPKGEGVVGPRWRRWFSLLWAATTEFFGADATLLHLVSIGGDLERVRRLADAIKPVDSDLARRLRVEIADLRGEEAANLTAWTMSKFQPLVSQRTMRQILGQSRDAVDVTDLMDDGQSLLIDLGGTRLGAPSSRMLGALWLLKHWVALTRRQHRDRPHIIIVDEAHLYTFGALPAMLAEARKYGVGVVIASQSMDDLAPQLRQAAEANVGSHFCFRLGLDTVAAAAARMVSWPVGELIRLPDFHAAASFPANRELIDPFLLSLPHPKRLKRLPEDLATSVEEQSRDRWRSQATLALPSDASIDQQLAHALSVRMRGANPPSSAAARSGPTPGGSGFTSAIGESDESSSRNPSFIDRLVLAKHRSDNPDAGERSAVSALTP